MPTYHYRLTDENGKTEVRAFSVATENLAREYVRTRAKTADLGLDPSDPIVLAEFRSQADADAGKPWRQVFIGSHAEIRGAVLRVLGEKTDDDGVENDDLAEAVGYLIDFDEKDLDQVVRDLHREDVIECGHHDEAWRLVEVAS